MNTNEIQNKVTEIISEKFDDTVRDALVYEDENGEIMIDVNAWNEDVSSGKFFDCDFGVAAKKFGIDVSSVGTGDGDGVRIFIFKVLEVA